VDAEEKRELDSVAAAIISDADLVETLVEAIETLKESPVSCTFEIVSVRVKDEVSANRAEETKESLAELKEWEESKLNRPSVVDNTESEGGLCD
jgi:hypothetical protein